MDVRAWIKRRRFFAKNPLIYRQYKEIKRINVRPGDQETLEKLRQIKAYAISHCPFYAGFSPEDPFPVMTKMDFIAHAEQICSDEVFAEPLHITSTSGSTGTPFVVKQDASKRARNIADLKVYGEYAMYRSHEKMLQLRAYNGAKLDRSVDRRENIWRYDICHITEENMEQFLDFVLEWKPVILFGYVSTLEIICNYVLASGKTYPFSCKSVLVGAEMLTAETVEKIQKVFGCPVFDRYSNMEMGIYAQREYGKNNFRVNKASYYFEVLKLDSDEPAQEHEIGRLVFTDLHNHAFPMIRYDTGDLGSWCMRSGERELETVYGRKVDTICDTRGGLVDPHRISRAMWGVAHITQWQFIQQDQGRYLLKLNVSGQIDEDDIRSRMTGLLGNDAQVALEYVDDIPVMHSQKRKYIVNAMTRREA